MPFVSPARRHFEQETARQAAEQNSEIDLNQLTAYQRLYKSLQDDKAILKAIFGNEDKAKAKAEMLPNYADWLQGVMAGQHAQVGDKITPTVLVWFIDCGLLDEAMPLVTFAMQTGMDSRVDRAALLDHRLRGAYWSTITGILYRILGCAHYALSGLSQPTQQLE